MAPTISITPKMQVALAHYAKHKHKANAYRHAYNCANMNNASVRNEAFELFRHPLVAAAVSSMEAVIALKTNIDAAWVLKRAALLAEFNINTFVVTDAAGKAVYDFSGASDDDWYCIAEYTVEQLTKGQGSVYSVEKTRIKAHCKLKALELVGRLNGSLGKTQVEIVGAVGIAQLSTEEYKQAREDMISEDNC